MVETMSPNGTMPTFVEIVGAPRFSANQLRQLMAVSGLPLERLMGNGADVLQAFAYITLLQQGCSPTWEQAGEVPISFVEERADPT